MVCNASVIIPLIARSFSASYAFQDSEESEPHVATIGGTGRKQRNNTTRLSTLQWHDPEMTAVHVDVATESEAHSLSGWEQKRRTSVDRESYDPPPPTKTAGLDDA